MQIPSAQVLAQQLKQYSSNIGRNRHSIANAAAMYFSKYANQEPNAALGEGKYIIPYTPNKNGTALIYYPSGQIKQEPLSNYIQYNQTTSPKFKWLAQYIYRQEKGGVITHQSGGNIANLRGQLRTADSLEYIRRNNPDKLPVGFVYDPEKINRIKAQLTKAYQVQKNQANPNSFIAPGISTINFPSCGFIS